MNKPIGHNVWADYKVGDLVINRCQHPVEVHRVVRIEPRSFSPLVYTEGVWPRARNSGAYDASWLRLLDEASIQRLHHRETLAADVRRGELLALLKG